MFWLQQYIWWLILPLHLMFPLFGFKVCVEEDPTCKAICTPRGQFRPYFVSIFYCCLLAALVHGALRCTRIWLLNFNAHFPAELLFLSNFRLFLDAWAYHCFFFLFLWPPADGTHFPYTKSVYCGVQRFLGGEGILLFAVSVALSPQHFTFFASSL